MENTCVCCGRVIPEGGQVCTNCLNEGIKCQECGSVLELMATSTGIVNDELVLCKLYHCNNCHLDWELEASNVGDPTEFTRKFWG